MEQDPQYRLDAEQEKRRLAIRIVTTLALFVFPSVLISVGVPRILVNRTDQTAVYTALALGGACGSLAGGILSRRISMLSLLRHGISAAAVSFVLLACTPLNGIGLVFVFCAFAGITAAGVAGLTLLPLLRPASPRHTLSLSLASSALAGVAFPVIASGVFSGWAGRGVPMEGALSAGLLLTSAVLLLARIFLNGPVADSLSPASTALTRSEWKFAAIAGTLGAIHSATDNCLAYWSMLHFSTSYKISAFPPAWILSGCALAYFFTRLGLAFVPERTGGIWFLIAPGIAGASLLWLSFSQQSFVSAAWIYVLAAAFFGLEFPVLLGFVARMSSRCMGPVIAISTVGAYVICAVANPLLGSVAVRYDSAGAAIALLPLGFLAFSLLAFIAIPRRASSSKKSIDLSLDFPSTKPVRTQ